ncbi:MAG: glycogen synthase GlgA [Verrucomicrobia bacterium]|jgi:starch synthase|nr:glycogen synthase GlgA [Verrucomicrobiota bacterium]OQC67263.1 MAG: Glycogen synthase [Verrucomicrobia bacterium ADurb.Bin006]MDI9381506.1 glycogen synthase GlgA [Verrucomicrobiota bacterium]NMD19232.1 glycogen synthase GlgA [Verrucomicrobiota bacterium]HNU98356.1 glycogen synthase GlgA [Verrucomicrobiota bacterium]
MRILLASSEIFPYSKSGGLADMVAALAKSLAAAGHQVGVVTPLYAGIRERFHGLHPFDWRMQLPLGGNLVSASVWVAEPAANLTLYFIDQPGFFRRRGLYGTPQGEFADNADRFVFFAKCVAHLARYLPWVPQVVHVNDWHTALTPLLIRHQALTDGWAAPPATCLTIHNLAYQGVYPAQTFALSNLPWSYFTADGAEFHGQFNCLKTGLVSSDAITTVSPSYAGEIQTPDHGCGLEGVLRLRAGALTGILNGVDYDEWRTTGNRFLAAPYEADDLSGKDANKLALQREMGLPPMPGTPLFGMVTRLVHQKGIDLALGALEEMLAGDLQFVLLGSGLVEFQEAFLELEERHPLKAAIRLGYNHALAHRIEAGCDFFLMPSQFEPSGLNQMYSLRYGTVPVVRATGGLIDSVVDIRENLERANGIKFRDYSTAALAKAMRKALALYREPDLLLDYRRNGMRADFSWDRSTAQYVEVYRRITRRA